MGAGRIDGLTLTYSSEAGSKLQHIEQSGPRNNIKVNVALPEDNR